MKAPIDPGRIGLRIRELRMERGWSQEELAGILGVHRNTVWSWEKGRAAPAKDHTVLLCQIFGVSPEAFGLPPDFLVPALRGGGAPRYATSKMLAWQMRAYRDPLGQALMERFGLSVQATAYLLAFLEANKGGTHG